MYRRLKQPILIVLATGLTAWLSQWLELSAPYLSVVSCYVLMKAYSSNIHLKSFERVLGAVIAVVIIGVVMELGRHYLWLQMLCYGMVIFLFMYYHRLQKRPYAMLIASVILGFAMATELTVSANAALNAGKSWMLDVILGAIIAILVQGESWKILKADVLVFFSITRINWKKTLQIWHHHIFIWDRMAFIAALQLVLAFALILTSNEIMGWQQYSAQALIAAAVITSQLTSAHGHHKLNHRLTGVLIGTVLTILTIQFLPTFL